MKEAMWKVAVAAATKRGGDLFEELFYCENKADPGADATKAKLDAAYPFVRDLICEKFTSQRVVSLQTIKDFLLSGPTFPYRWATMCDHSGTILLLLCMVLMLSLSFSGRLG